MSQGRLILKYYRANYFGSGCSKAHVVLTIYFAHAFMSYLEILINNILLFCSTGPPQMTSQRPLSIFIGVGRFRILGGPRFRILGGAKGGQTPSRHMTS